MTDHGAQKYLSTIKHGGPRRARALQPFSYTIKHRAGESHSNADDLSRLEWTPQTMQDTTSDWATKEGEGGVAPERLMTSLPPLPFKVTGTSPDSV